MSRTARWWPGLTLLVWLALASVLRADARPDLDVTALAGGVRLRGFTSVLRDPSGEATIDEVIRAEAAGRFAPSSMDTALGWTHDAVWVHFVARNPAQRPIDWLLELPFPHLDHVDLYAVLPEGRRVHLRGGDQLPFAVREIDHANPLFPQTTPAAATVHYFLRARTETSMRVPLRAWYARDFVAADGRLNAALWLFYGAMLMMAWYNLCVSIVIRSSEHAYLSGLLMSIALTVGALSGHLYQYLVPNHPVVHNRSLWVLLPLVVMFMNMYAREVVGKIEPTPSMVKIYRYTIAPSWVLLVIGMFAPRAWAPRFVFVGIGVYALIGLAVQAAARRVRDPQLRFSVLSYNVLIVPLPIAVLAHANLIPPHPLALWSAHIGCAAYCVLASLALPVRLKTVSARLAALNAQLSVNVDDLKIALRRAEQATEDARRATLVKDEFMATMSHELRTPLNAIINVPQGLLEDFPTVRAATCGMCNAQFVLDPGDAIDADTTCPDCQERGTLRADTLTQYVGKPAHTARFLAKIERSGRHLLQMVNGVLDFSKMEAGRLELALEPLDVGKLLRETIDELIDVARDRGLDIVLHAVDDPEPGLGDAVRLRQVLLNLLSNAIKFSEPGGVIEVRWKRDPDNDVVSVTDMGIGIAPEDHARIFASFEQVHKGDTRKYGGTGLGLSISRSLVRMHGGELWVERSKPREGATFTFRIPRSMAAISDRVNERSQVRTSSPVIPRPERRSESS